MVIVGVEVSTSGSDMAQLAPMVSQVEQRLGEVPAQWLVDGGFPAHEQIDAVADKTEVYAPVPEPRAKKDDQGNEIAQDKHQPKPDDSPAWRKWRQRMATDEAKELYKLRAATAECVNAQARNRGLQRMPVRGRAKVRCVALLFALAHNLMRTVALVPEHCSVWAELRPHAPRGLHEGADDAGKPSNGPLRPATAAYWMNSEPSGRRSTASIAPRQARSSARI